VVSRPTFSQARSGRWREHPHGPPTPLFVWDRTRKFVQGRCSPCHVIDRGLTAAPAALDLHITSPHRGYPHWNESTGSKDASTERAVNSMLEMLCSPAINT
jgi:hypothetical protein